MLSNTFNYNNPHPGVTSMNVMTICWLSLDQEVDLSWFHQNHIHLMPCQHLDSTQKTSISSKSITKIRIFVWLQHKHKILF